MPHQRVRGHGVGCKPKAMTYTVILVKGKQTRPTWTIEADSADEAWEEARKLFPATDLAIVANEA